MRTVDHQLNSKLCPGWSKILNIKDKYKPLCASLPVPESLALQSVCWIMWPPSTGIQRAKWGWAWGATHQVLENKTQAWLPSKKNFWDNLHRIPETQNHISNCEWQMTVVKRNYICQQGTNINWRWCNHFYSTFHNLIFNFALVFSAVFCVIHFIYPKWAIVTIHSQPLGQLLILLTPRLSLSSWQLTLLLISPF